MKVYLSGPMSGHPNWNYAAFDAAAGMLREAGHRVFNPAEIDLDPDTTPREAFLRVDLLQLTNPSDPIDCVMVLPGWTRSDGALTEAVMARAMGIPIYDYIIWNDSGDLEEVTGRIGALAHQSPRTMDWRPIVTMEGWHDSDVQKDTAPLYQGAVVAQQKSFGETVFDLYTAAGDRLDLLSTAQSDALEEYDRQEAEASLRADLNGQGDDESVLQEAQRIVYGARQQSYGHPLANHGLTARYWSTLFGIPITPQNVCEAMILQKLSRNAHRYSRDNMTDIAGYAANLAMVEEKLSEIVF